MTPTLIRYIFYDNSIENGNSIRSRTPIVKNLFGLEDPTAKPTLQIFMSLNLLVSFVAMHKNIS